MFIPSSTAVDWTRCSEPESASGTEPAVRVMVEAVAPDTARRVAEDLAAVVGEAAKSR